MDRDDIFCVTSVSSVGCTFLDWSIHWLSGRDRIYYAKGQKWLDVVDSPLRSSSVSNAHGHSKNHESGRSANQSLVESLISTKGDGGKSFYPFPLYLDHCCRHLDIPVNDLALPETKKIVDQFQQQDYIKLLEWVTTDKKIPCIFVAFDRSALGYRWHPRALERFSTRNEKPKDTNDLWDEFQDTYFRDSIKKWQSLELTQPWDVRERMALDIRPFENDAYDDLCLPFKHHWVNCQDLWFDTERSVTEIMDFLGYEISKDRYQSWVSTVKEWQVVHNDSLKFYRRLPHIVNSIVHGTYCDMPELSLQHEAIIQHCLIYQHGLNLKTWKLEKFPSNTLDLHRLLEPNIHPL